jgi:hypothetical protein
MYDSDKSYGVQDGVIFRTLGEIDIKAFTCFGISSKPNSPNPIGYFGTGLKYAIAVLLRHGISVNLWIGEHEYVFYQKQVEFRDKSFAQIMLKRRKGLLARWTYEELPFTTELGKNWELWQAFRELEANTRDENGSSVVVIDVGNSEALRKVVMPESGVTQIAVVSMTFANLKRHQQASIFLPDDYKDPTRRDVWLGAGVHVISAPSKYLYYRSLRVYEFPKQMMSVCTYNLIGAQTLTEDRTIASIFAAELDIVRTLVQMVDTNLISRVLGAADDSFEAQLSWEYSSTKPTDEFKRLLEQHHPQVRGGAEPSRRFAGRLVGYYNSVFPKTSTVPEWRTRAAKALRANNKVEAWEILACYTQDLIELLDPDGQGISREAGECEMPF